MLFFAVLLVMVLAPIGGQIATAGEDASAQATEEPEILDPTEEPSEGEEEEPTAEPTSAPENDQLGSIEIDYWECPDSYNVMDPDLENLYEDCTGVDGVPFSVITSDGGSQSQHTGEFGNAHVSFTGLPTGTTAISGPGGTSTAWCNGIVQHGGPETGYQPIDAGSGTITWNLQDDEIVYCSWLTVPEGEVQGHDTTTRVVIDTYQCAPGVMPNANDHHQVLGACPDRLPNVKFTVRNAAQEFTGTAVSDGTTGVAIIEEVPTGEIVVEQRVPAGFTSPLVYCRLVNAFDVSSAGSGYEAISHTNGTFSYRVDDPARHLYCDVFNLPEPTSATTGAIEIEYRTCPEGYAFLDATVRSQLEIMLMDCAIENSIEFRLDQAGTNGNPRTTGNDGYGRVVFNGVPAGMRKIQQTSPWGDANTFVVCEGVLGGSSTGLVLMQHANGAIQWDLKAGQVLSCGWFVGDDPGMGMPDGGGTVTIRYHECPMETDFATLPESDLATACTGTRDGVAFRTISGGQYDETAATGEDVAGEATFANVVPGLIYVQQVTPAKQLIVICQTDAAVSTPNRLPVTQAQIEWVLQEGETLTCDWYVIPGPGMVAILTYACGAGTDPDLGAREAAKVCTNDPGYVEFTLTNRNHAQTVMTNDRDQAMFEEVPPGQVVIGQEDLVSVGDAIVECEVRVDGNVVVPVFDVPVSNQLSIVLTLNPGEYITCYWNLVPVDQTDGGNARLELATYACNGEAIPDTAETYEQFITLCAPETLPVKFTISGQNGFTKSRTITGNGIVENILPGEIAISPALPAGTVSVRVFCSGRGIDATDYELVWGSYEAGETGAIDYTIQADFHKYCSWFMINDPANPQGGGGLTVITYTCTTETFVPGSDCEIEGDGVGFDLLHWNGDAWQDMDSGTTDGSGILHFTGLDAGEYWLDKQGSSWCWLASDNLAGTGNWLNIADGEETIVHVYTCGESRGTPGWAVDARHTPDRAITGHLRVAPAGYAR